MAKYKYWLNGDGLLLLSAWARDGLTDEQIAVNCGISPSTLYAWKVKYSEISEALKRGKDIADIEVENALYRRALGYSYTIRTKERIVDGGQKKRHKEGVELSEKEWEITKSYFGFKCCYCGAADKKLTRDHVKPLAKGGAFHFENVIPACQSCNSSKCDRDWEPWYKTQTFFKQSRAERIKEFLAFAATVKAVEATGNSELVVTKEVTVDVPPSVTAQIFWLKNRKPKTWRDRPPEDKGDFLEAIKLLADSNREAAKDALQRQTSGCDS